MKTIYIITASIRENRIGSDVTNFVVEHFETKHDVVEIDLKDWLLPYVDGGVPAAAGGDYETKGADLWAAKIDEADGFIFVTPEYNASIPAQLKTSLDAIYDEWLEKSALIVSYSGSKGGGASSANHLTDILNRLKMNVAEPVSLAGWGTEHHDEDQYNQQLSSGFKEFEQLLS